MKDGIHPDYREVVFLDLSNNYSFVTRSTVKTKETVKSDDIWEDDRVDLDPSEYEAEGVNYTNFVPLLLNLLKRQKTELETLKEKVAALENV